MLQVDFYGLDGEANRVHEGSITLDNGFLDFRPASEEYAQMFENLRSWVLAVKGKPITVDTPEEWLNGLQYEFRSGYSNASAPYETGSTEKAAKEKVDGRWVTINGRHIFIDAGGELHRGPGAIQAAVEHGQSERAARARATYVPVNTQTIKSSRVYEKKVATTIGMQDLPDNEAFDVVDNADRPRIGIEVKTIQPNAKNDKITMHPPSLARKLAVAKKFKTKVYTVAIDMRAKPPKWFFKEGLGSFRTNSMQEIKQSDLKKLIRRG